MEKYKDDVLKTEADGEKLKFEYFNFSETQVKVKKYRWCTCGGGKWDFLSETIESK